jgi:hypothetical protein
MELFIFVCYACLCKIYVVHSLYYIVCECARACVCVCVVNLPLSFIAFFSIIFKDVSRTLYMYSYEYRLSIDTYPVSQQIYYLILDSSFLVFSNKRM